MLTECKNSYRYKGYRHPLCGPHNTGCDLCRKKYADTQARLAAARTGQEDLVKPTQQGVEEMVLHSLDQLHILRMSDNTYWLCGYRRGERVPMTMDLVEGKIVLSLEPVDWKDVLHAQRFPKIEATECTERLLP